MQVWLADPPFFGGPGQGTRQIIELFVAFGLGFRRLIGVFTVVRRNSRWVTRIGGAMLILVGLVLLTGGWGEFTIWLRSTFGAGPVSI